MSGTWRPGSSGAIHVDFATPANSTFTLAGNLTPAGYTVLCPTTRSCVPQAGTTSRLDAIGDRGMFRLAYRRFGRRHEALVGNQTVSSGRRRRAFAGTRSTTPPPVRRRSSAEHLPARHDVALDGQRCDGSERQPGDRVQRLERVDQPADPLRGRLAADPANTLAQGEATLFSGTGSQTGTSNRWGDYSDLTVDPVERLHVLVHAGVLLDHDELQLAHADRDLHVPELRRASASRHLRLRHRRPRLLLRLPRGR
jgi:hypothetical protein